MSQDMTDTSGIADAIEAWQNNEITRERLEEITAVWESGGTGSIDFDEETNELTGTSAVRESVMNLVPLAAVAVVVYGVISS